MNINNEKEIKEYVLDLENDNYEMIDFFLEHYFDETSNAIFSALYMLLKKYEKNKNKVIYIVNLLENVIEINIENKNDANLMKIANLIIGLNYKIGSNFSNKDKILINDVSFRINSLLNYINNYKYKVRKLK